MRWLLISFLVITLTAAPMIAAFQDPPRPINYGQTVEGEINDVQQAVQYIFDAQSDDEITILMQTTGGDLNTALELATFEGETIAGDDDSGGGTDALIQFTIEEAGSYVITASRSRTAENGGGSGSFSLALSTGQLAIPEAQEIEVGPRLQPILRGTPIQGALTSEERFSLYWFEGRTDETITVSADTGTSLQPILVLYDAGFTELVRSAPGAPLNVTLPGADLYFIAATLPNAASPGGNYALTMNSGTATVLPDPPRDVQPGQNAIAYGESVRGTINDTAASFTFQFSGSAGDTVEISMARAGGDLDSYLYLLDSGGITLAEDDNSGSGNGDARISSRLTASGDYIILATRRDQAAGSTAGNFLLSVQSDAAPNPIATPAVGGRPSNLAGFPEIAIGESVSGTITNALYFNVYVFQAQAEDAFVITQEATGDETLDSLLLLLNANQEQLAENDDIQQGEIRDSRIDFTAPSDGYYVLVASRFDQELGESEGSYRLTVRRADEESTSADTTSAPTSSSLIRRLNAEPIIPGATPPGIFEPNTFARTYTFGSAEQGNLVDFSVSTDNNIATTVIMTDDRLQPVAVTDGGTLLGVELTSPGNYLFIIAPAAGPAEPISENYILAFNAEGDNTFVAEDQDEVPEVEILPISYSETVTGELSDDLPQQDYIFVGTADDNIRIRLTALPDSGLDTVVRLVDADGNVIAENDDITPGENRNSLLQTQLPADGQYTIHATRFTPTDGTAATEGGFELTLEYVEPGAVGVSPTVDPILPGETVSNSVNQEQYLMFYSFTANSGDIITLEVNTISGDLDAVMYLYTYTSAGDPVEIARNDDSPRGGTFDPLIENFSIPRTGTYLIAVGRFPEGTSSGDFTLTLNIRPPGSTTDESESDSQVDG